MVNDGNGTPEDYRPSEISAVQGEHTNMHACIPPVGGCSRSSTPAQILPQKSTGTLLLRTSTRTDLEHKLELTCQFVRKHKELFDINTNTQTVSTFWLTASTNVWINSAGDGLIGATKAVSSVRSSKTAFACWTKAEIARLRGRASIQPASAPAPLGPLLGCS